MQLPEEQSVLDEWKRSINVAWLKLIIDVVTKLDSRIWIRAACAIIAWTICGARVSVKVADLEFKINDASAMYLNTVIDDHRTKQQLLMALTALANKGKEK